MKVLCVVTDKTLKSRQPAEQCTLDLEHGLIAHFMHKNDERLENESTAAGKCTTSEKKRAHVLYLVMKFGPKKCKCGSTTHRRTSHHECRLRKPCKCGSTSHQRTNHRNCPHNKKYKKWIQVFSSPSKQYSFRFFNFNLHSKSTHRTWSLVLKIYFFSATKNSSMFFMFFNWSHILYT